MLLVSRRDRWARVANSRVVFPTLDPLASQTASSLSVGSKRSKGLFLVRPSKRILFSRKGQLSQVSGSSSSPRSQALVSSRHQRQCSVSSLHQICGSPSNKTRLNMEGSDPKIRSLLSEQTRPDPFRHRLRRCLGSNRTPQSLCFQ